MGPPRLCGCAPTEGAVPVVDEAHQSVVREYNVGRLGRIESNCQDVVFKAGEQALYIVSVVG